MRAYVLTDRALTGQAGRFVWLSINGERAKNAGLVRNRLKLTAYPTLYVLDPKDERIALRWVGAANKERLLTLLDDATVAVATGGTLKGGPGASQIGRAHV